MNELRLFFLNVTMTEQQKVVLEIFEKQNEGVVIIQKSTDPEEQIQTVLYSNSLFKEIVGTENEAEGIQKQILRQSPEEGTVLRAQELKDFPAYSVRDLLDKEPEFISGNVFIHLKEGEWRFYLVS